MSKVVLILINSIVAFVYLFIVAKLLGKKQIAQLTMVDYVIGISIGSIAADWCADDESPWYYYIIAMSVFFIFSLVIDFLERKTPFLKNFFKGREIIIFENGKINYKNLKKSKLDVNDMLGLCREKDFFDLTDIELITFETNGQISILPKGESTPPTISDLLNPQIKPASAPSYLIIDGKIDYNSLSLLKKNREWLFKKSRISSKKDLKNIILAQFDEENNTIILHTKKNGQV